MNDPEKHPLLCLPTDALEEAYRNAKQEDSEYAARVVRLIGRELIRRKMQPAKEETK